MKEKEKCEEVIFGCVWFCGVRVEIYKWGKKEVYGGKGLKIDFITTKIVKERKRRTESRKKVSKHVKSKMKEEMK